MSNAQDYRNQAAEFARLATETTSPRLVNELRQRARAFRNLAENEEWVEANRDKIISHRAPADGRIGHGTGEDHSAGEQQSEANTTGPAHGKSGPSARRE